MIEINLVPDVKQELIKAQMVRSAVITISIIVGLASIAVVVLLSIYVFGVQTVQKGLQDNSINSESSTLFKIQDLSKTLTIQNQLAQIASLNANKSIDSRVFAMLQTVIPPSPNNVAISSLALDSVAETVTLEAQAPNGYSAAEVFKKTIGSAVVNYTDSTGKKQTEPLASNISLTNTNYGQDSNAQLVLTFTISFTYSTDIFSPTATNVSVSVPSTGDATDSALGVPTSIFAAPATSVKGNN